MNVITPVKTFDAPYRETQQQRAAFAQIRNAERYYGVQLRKIAQHIHDLVRQMHLTTAADIDTLQRILERYADVLRPWAGAVARRMLADVERRDANAWSTYAKVMGVEVEKEIRDTPMGEAYNLLMDQQVHLITSLPRDAAKRVHELATSAIYTGARPEEIAKQIMETGNVTKARANLIARTEIGRAASTFAATRAEQIGSQGYIWRTAKDVFVRPRHKRLEGSYHRWDTPPVTGENGERSLPGATFNCRCYPEPVLPE